MKIAEVLASTEKIMVAMKAKDSGASAEARTLAAAIDTVVAIVRWQQLRIEELERKVGNL
jgi:hypothetical protein